MKEIPLNDEVVEALERQLERFRAKFGREPLPHEPVFFDPAYDNPVPYTEEKLKKIVEDAVAKAKERGGFFPPTEDIIEAFMGDEEDI